MGKNIDRLVAMTRVFRELSRSGRNSIRHAKVTVELVGRKELPPDWFEHSAHHGEERPVLRMGL